MYKKNMGLNFLDDLEEKNYPIVYDGMNNQKTVICFNNYFENKNITELINKIESVRQIGGYVEIDLYFSSNGGDANCLFMLADYLNNIKGIQINFIANGMLASAGFYILLLIENTNIDIIFNDFCEGLIHLGDSYISYRGQLTKEDARYNHDKFHAQSLEMLNNYFFKEILPNLNLSDKDLKLLEEGRDILLHKEELERVVSEYHYKKYLTSEEFVETYCNLKNKEQDTKSLLKKMQDDYKKYYKKDLDVELGLKEKKIKKPSKTKEIINDNI